MGRVLLLHISPSKQDRERMVVVAPRAGRRAGGHGPPIRAAVGSTGTALPSLAADDYAECVNSDPLPFLFQRAAGRAFKGTTAPMHKAYVPGSWPRSWPLPGCGVPTDRP
ncbi:MAG: hypothetical protein LC808_01430 [Actinobacteria bacterium]|nr:hypothetical protein [Actinomycetota bacterium]